jgi:hypothetical protein
MKLNIALIVVFLSTSCVVGTSESMDQGGWRCGHLPETFQESDLIGEWKVTHEAGTSSDVIILRKDRTYKQMYSKSNGESYESLWNRWWIEHRPSGGLYIHLEGMRYCHITDEVCENQYGGGGNRTFWDFCEDRRFKMVREVVLAVVGAEDPDPLYGLAPRGIILLHMRPGIEHVPGYWRLQE